MDSVKLILVSHFNLITSNLRELRDSLPSNSRTFLFLPGVACLASPEKYIFSTSGEISGKWKVQLARPKAEWRPLRDAYSVEVSIQKENGGGSTVRNYILGGVLAVTEERNSITEKQCSLPPQVLTGALSSDSTFHLTDTRPKKRKAVIPTTGVDKTESLLYETLSATRVKPLQINVLDVKTLHQKCLQELQSVEESDDLEFTKTVNVLGDDTNTIAFMTIKGPGRLIWLRPQWQAQ
ncbi:hypothetical protein NMG60_11019451 [Bertholletia excelsa]